MAQVRLPCVLLKKKCIMNKIKLIRFYSLYRNFCLSNNEIFLYILRIFFTYDATLDNIFRILNNYVYFQNTFHAKMQTNLSIDYGGKYVLVRSFKAAFC